MVTQFCRRHRPIVLAAVAWFCVWLGAAAPAAAQEVAPAPTPIQSREKDSLLNGILIGAGVGAVPGIYWLIADPNECTGLCPEDYAAIAVGAVLGGLIDRAITRKVTVNAAGAPVSSARHLRIGPLVGRRRSGVQLALRF